VTPRLSGGRQRQPSAPERAPFAWRSPKRLRHVAERGPAANADVLVPKTRFPKRRFPPFSGCAQPSGRYRMMAKESFDLADANRREPTIGSGTGPFSRAPLPLSAAPPASTSPRYGTSRIRKHDTGSFHHFRRSAPAASSSCMLGTSANEQLTWRPRFTDVAASDRRCRCRSAHPSRTRSLNAGPLVH
jgi:hypothetical protein